MVWCGVQCGVCCAVLYCICDAMQDVVQCPAALLCCVNVVLCGAMQRDVM